MPVQIKSFAGYVVIALAILLACDYLTGADLLTSDLASLLGFDSDDDGDDGGDGTQDGSAAAASSGGVAGAILGALASFENVASKHNNPGAICGSFDDSGNCLGPKTYGSLEEGTAAAVALINKYLVRDPAITVAQFVKKWSGASGQVLSNYTNSVASALGLDPDEPISDAGGDD